MGALDALVLLAQRTERGWARRLFRRWKKSTRIPSSTAMRLMQQFLNHSGVPMRAMPDSLSLERTAFGVRSLSRYVSR